LCCTSSPRDRPLSRVAISPMERGKEIIQAVAETLSRLSISRRKHLYDLKSHTVHRGIRICKRSRAVGRPRFVLRFSKDLRSDSSTLRRTTESQDVAGSTAAL